MVGSSMTESERILALEAALSACEGCVPCELTESLRNWIDKVIDHNPDMQDFGIFCDKQKRAVQLLAKNPQVFGG
jgi:hypothetical protein